MSTGISNMVDESPLDADGALQDEIEDLAAALLIHGERGDASREIVTRAFSLAEEFIAERERRRALDEGTL
jgi:hypothetical protein